MRAKAIGFMTIALFARMAFAQTSTDANVDRVFHFVHTDAVQAMGEIATVVRSIANAPKASVDSTQKTLTLGGTAVQIVLAEWLFDSTAAGLLAWRRLPPACRSRATPSRISSSRF